MKSLEQCLIENDVPLWVREKVQLAVTNWLDEAFAMREKIKKEIK